MPKKPTTSKRKLFIQQYLGADVEYKYAHTDKKGELFREHLQKLQHEKQTFLVISTRQGI